MCECVCVEEKVCVCVRGGLASSRELWQLRALDAGPARLTTGPPCVSPAPADHSSPHLVPFYGQCAHRRRRLPPLTCVQSTRRRLERFFLNIFFYFALSFEGAGRQLRIWLLTLERKQEVLRKGVLVSGEGSREVVRDLVWRSRTEETHTDWTVSSCEPPPPHPNPPPP